MRKKSSSPSTNLLNFNFLAKIVFFYRNEWEEHLKLNYGNECKGNNRYEGDNKET